MVVDKPILYFLVLIAVIMFVLHFTPAGDFMHEHSQFFYVVLTLGAIPTGLFVFVLHSHNGTVPSSFASSFFFPFTHCIYFTLPVKYTNV